MRCPDCNKFVSNDQPDPEVENLEESDGTIRAEVRVVIACADCGTELKEATLEVEHEIDEEILKAHPQTDDDGQPNDAHTLEVEEGFIEATDRCEGKGRGLKTFYGFRLEVTLSCSCGDEIEGEIELTDDVQASAMDEC